jgi:nitroreductase / dihydropteridine reductase
MSLINDLNWRYATKKMNGENIPEEKLNPVLTATNLSASSYGLQPFKIYMVTNHDTKQKLQEASYNQPQVGSCSHVLVFTVPLKISEAYIQEFINFEASERNIPVSILEDYKNTMMSTVGALPAEQQQIWATKQAYIALGTALAAAAEQRIDACPMEGFDAMAFDKILGLTEKGFKSVVMLVLGYRAETDLSAKYTKVRKPINIMFEMIS